MRDRCNNLRAVVLAGLIAMGCFIQTMQAQAGDVQEMVVAGGCFWCVESDFESVRGVTEVISGYTGGDVKDPTYTQVTRGGTGHYEAVRILYDPARITRPKLLSLFFRSIDPTDAGGQFCDRGNSYRTAIFVSDAAEKLDAETARAEAQAALGQNIVTPILERKTFFDAEDYHQDYYKGKKIVITRFGPRRQSKAYKLYREACGRDARVRQLWGNQAPFAGS